MLIKHLNNQLKEQRNQEDLAPLCVTLTSEELNPNFHMENETYIIESATFFFSLHLQQTYLYMIVLYMIQTM